MKRNIIFLDIDGVISTIATRYNCFDPICSEYLKRIIYGRDAYIVVSSTWRKLHPINELRQYFRDVGIDGSRIIGITGIDREREKNRAAGLPWGRGKEISMWLEKYPDEVDRYIVIDDDVADIPPHRHVHIKTDSYNGLKLEDVEMALRLFDGEVNEVENSINR